MAFGRRDRVPSSWSGLDSGVFDDHDDTPSVSCQQDRPPAPREIQSRKTLWGWAGGGWVRARLPTLRPGWPTEAYAAGGDGREFEQSNRAKAGTREPLEPCINPYSSVPIGQWARGGKTLAVVHDSWRSVQAAGGGATVMTAANAVDQALGTKGYIIETQISGWSVSLRTTLGWG